MATNKSELRSMIAGMIGMTSFIPRGSDLVTPIPVGQRNSTLSCAAARRRKVRNKMARLSRRRNR